MKKKLLLALVVLVLGMLTISGSLAWVVRSSEVTNTFTIGEVKAEIDQSSGVITNTGTVPVYVRVALMPIWQDGEDVLGLTSEGTYTLVCNQDWFQAEDGFYYYEKILNPKSTTQLVTKCVVNENLGDVYKGKTFTLNMVVSFIQSNVPNAVEEVWSAKVNLATKRLIKK
jgi:hypothetical protein